MKLDELKQFAEGSDLCAVCNAPNPWITFTDGSGLRRTYCLKHTPIAFFDWVIYGKWWQKVLLAGATLLTYLAFFA